MTDQPTAEDQPRTEDQLSADDLLYLAELMKKIRRPKDGLDLMEKLSKLKPSFNDVERSSFGIIFKEAVDTIRKSLRALTENYEYEEKNGKPDYCERIKGIINETFSDLKNLCEKTLKFIDEELLPNAESSQAKVFFLKLKGDIYRYLSEFAEDGEKDNYLTSAEDSYLAAIPISKSDLKKSDPVRLGLILNYAVFKYEHVQAFDEAKDLLNDAIQLLDNDFSDLSPETADESKAIIEVMQSNLQNWNQVLSDGEEEEEES